MKKLTLSLIAATALCYSHFTFSASAEMHDWTGFYIGGNAGYWESIANKVSTSGSVSFINPTFELGASNVANALAQMANNSSSLNAYGFIGGGQVGYNYETCKNILVGLDI